MTVRSEDTLVDCPGSSNSTSCVSLYTSFSVGSAPRSCLQTFVEFLIEQQPTTKTCAFTALSTVMAPHSKSLDSHSDTPSQADTPMTDANEEAVTSMPVDSADPPMTVSDVENPDCLVLVPSSCARANISHNGTSRGGF